MKRLMFSTRMTFLIAGVGWLAAMLLVLWVGTLGTANADRLRSVMLAPSPTASSPTCTNAISTTPDSLVSQNLAVSFDSPANLGGTYNGLALVRNSVNQGMTITVYPEYFNLYAIVGAQYTLEVVPQSGDNYQLALDVFDDTFNKRWQSTSPDNFRASITFVPTDTSISFYRVVVYQRPANCRAGYYNLTYRVVDPAPTPTSTSGPSPTPSPTPPPGNMPDQYDTPPNHNDAITEVVALGQASITGLTICRINPPSKLSCNPDVGDDDQDWFRLYALAGYEYTVSAAPDGTYPYLFMRITGPGADLSKEIFKDESSSHPSHTWVVQTSGDYYIQIKRAGNSPTISTYHLTWSTTGPTVTPTSGPEVTETPVPGADAFEPNYDFDHASSIGLNVKYTGINFVPTLGGTVDNDYFRVRVKRGMLVTCETVDLSPGTDTNMILYDNDRNGLAGNDDADPSRGELRSRVTVSINYDGFLYVLVGLGYGVPDFQASQYNYALQCTTPGNTVSTPTSTPVSAGGPTYTPAPPATPLPSATSPATPMPPISVRALPTPTPPGPAQHMVTADLRVSYDANGNGAADPGEGVVGLPARVYDEVTGALLAQGFTDDSGHAVFTVPAAGSIRVTVPYLGFETIVSPAGAAIPVLISPRELPSLIP